MISAFFAGVGGGLYGALLGTVDPKNFLFTLTYNFLLIIVLGGMGSITGSMLVLSSLRPGWSSCVYLTNP